MKNCINKILTTLLIVVFVSFGILIHPASANGPITLVQQKATGTKTSSTEIEISFDDVLTAGDSIILTVSYSNEANPPNQPLLEGVDDEYLTEDATSTVSGAAVSIFHIHNVAGGETGIYISFNDDPGNIGANVSEWSGLVNATAEDPHTANATASATISTGNVSPTSVNNLVIAATAFPAIYSSGPTNSFTRLNQAGSSTPNVVVSGAGTSAVNGTYTLRGTSSGKPYYNLTDASDSPFFYAISWDGSQWNMWTSGGTRLMYTSTDNVAYPWLATFVTENGSLPVPTVTHGADINFFQEAAYKIRSSSAPTSAGWGLSGSSNWASAIAAFGGTPPTPLSKVTGVNLSSYRVASWNNVSNESSFNVQLYKNGVASGSPISVTADTLSTDLNSAIDAGGYGVFNFTVTAVGDGAIYSDGAESDKSSSITIAPPKAGGGGSYSSAPNSFSNNSANNTNKIVTPECAISHTLRKGNKGQEVKCLQQKLNQILNLSLLEDGVFGSKTKEIVILFQKNYPPLTPDGVVGLKTRQQMGMK